MYRFKGRKYSTALGLQKAICKDSGAVENSMVHNDRVVTYVSRYVVAAVYDMEPPAAGLTQRVTRNVNQEVFDEAQRAANAALCAKGNES